MKKLVALLLIIALLLPAAALAADPDPIVGSWYLYFDKYATPEFETNFPGTDYAIIILTFTEDGTILGLEADISNKSCTPIFSAAGKWEKSGFTYNFSIMMLGSGKAIPEEDCLWLQISADQNIYMKCHKLNHLDFYNDYAMK